MKKRLTSCEPWVPTHPMRFRCGRTAALRAAPQSKGGIHLRTLNRQIQNVSSGYRGSYQPRSIFNFNRNIKPMKLLIAQEQGLSKGSKNLSGSAISGPRVLVSTFKSPYLSHRISISSDEQKLSYRMRYNVQSGSKNIKIKEKHNKSLKRSLNNYLSFFIFSITSTPYIK